MGGTIDEQGQFHFDDNRDMASDIEALRIYTQRKLGNANPNSFAATHGSALPATVPSRGRGRAIFSGYTGMPAWEGRHLVNLTIPQLRGRYHIPNVYEAAFARGAAGMQRYRDDAAARAGAERQATVRVNVLVVDQMLALFSAWEQRGLIDRVLYHIGFYLARYMGPENAASRPVSNHAYGTAFDINAMHNLQRRTSGVPRGGLGSVIELVPTAVDNGFYWGGLFSGGGRDLMHFEVAKLPGE